MYWNIYFGENIKWLHNGYGNFKVCFAENELFNSILDEYEMLNEKYLLQEINLCFFIKLKFFIIMFPDLQVEI